MKTLVIDEEEDARVPFLRGILTRSLQDAGLAFADAYELATRVRRELSNTSEVTVEDLRDQVVRTMQASHSSELVERYLARKSGVSTIQIHHSPEEVTPFSRTEHRRTLENVGLTSEESFAIVSRIEPELLATREVVTPELLIELTERCLAEAVGIGPAVAKRYGVWQRFLRSGRPLILLIGGTAGVGKSTIATALANRLDIVRTQSTDMLREVMRTMLPRKLLPVLHMSSYNAWEVLPGREKAEAHEADSLLVDGYRTQADLLSVASESVIDRALRERVSLILEGVHIQPAILDKLHVHDEAAIVHVVLAVVKKKELRRRIAGRATEAPARRSDRYLKHFDEIWRLQSLLLDEADNAGIPIVVNDDKDKVIREIIRVTIEQLSVADVAMRNVATS